MQVIEYVLINGGSLKSVKRKLGIGKNDIYGLRDKEGNVITNIDCIVEVAEEFYTDVYSSRNNADGNDGGRETDDLDIPPVTKEVRKVLVATQRGKAAGEDQVTADLLKDGEEIVLNKLAALCRQCFKTSIVPESWKNASIILIHKKGYVKDVKKYRSISLLAVTYKVFTKVIGN